MTLPGVPASGQTELTIVIVSFDARGDLDRCLASLHSPAPRLPHEIIVVDNASSDGSAALVAERWPRVRVVRNPTNMGFAHANNQALREARGRLALLLNSDTVVPAGAIDRLTAVLDAHQDVAAVGPRLIDARGRAELSFGRMVGPWNELRQKLLGRVHAQEVGFASRLVERMTRSPGYPDWVSAACLLVRREAAEAAGFLDERYFMYLEDVDFCAALRARGWRILFTPDVEIVHVRGRSRAAAPAATAQRYRQSQLAFYAKHHPRQVPWLRFYLRLRGTLQ